MFVFELHPDARWHDGEPVTADDVVFTYAVNAHPDTVSVNGQALNVIQGTGPDGKALPGQAFGVQKIDRTYRGDPHQVSHGRRCLYDPGCEQGPHRTEARAGIGPPGRAPSARGQSPTGGRRRTVPVCPVPDRSVCRVSKHRGIPQRNSQDRPGLPGNPARRDDDRRFGAGRDRHHRGRGDRRGGDHRLESDPGLPLVGACPLHADGVSGAPNQSQRAGL